MVKGSDRDPPPTPPAKRTGSNSDHFSRGQEDAGHLSGPASLTDAAAGV